MRPSSPRSGLWPSTVSSFSGGPGTGKSRTMAAVVSLTAACGLRVALAAPTGRAAKRLEELAGAPATALHRLPAPRAGPGLTGRRCRRRHRLGEKPGLPTPTPPAPARTTAARTRPEGQSPERTAAARTEPEQAGLGSPEGGAGAITVGTIGSGTTGQGGPARPGRRGGSRRRRMGLHAERGVAARRRPRRGGRGIHARRRAGRGTRRGLRGRHQAAAGRDPAQLPSIGPGRVLADIIDSGAVPVTELTRLYRQRDGGVIARLATAVRGGTLPAVNSPEREVVVLPVRGSADAARRVVQLVTVSIPRALGIPAADIQVTAPVHKGAARTIELNRALKRPLNPGPGARSGYNPGDRVVRSRTTLMRG